VTRWLSHAKINWYLRVLNRRADGYHNIETVFQEIGLADEMEFEPCGRRECVIAGLPGVPPEQNLILRAWRLMADLHDDRVGGLQVRVTKRIPMGGGLGGGSSNAATTLKAVRRLFSVPVDDDGLAAIGASLGSDVAFFIRGGCAVGRGRGEELESVPDARPIPLVLAFPDAHVSTAEAYARLARMRRDAPASGVGEMVDALRSGDPLRAAGAVHNDFQAVVSREPWFREAAGALLHAGCLRAFLTGSGSAVVGVLEKGNSASEIMAIVQQSFGGGVVAITSPPAGG
jgi:4-diphosphocytidyl-2-C-methyl-D-erythritol kinase